jgi:hypothetical protein
MRNRTSNAACLISNSGTAFMSNGVVPKNVVESKSGKIQLVLQAAIDIGIKLTIRLLS